jgi:hypothetical protein
MFYLSILGVALSLVISLGSRNDSRVYVIITFIAIAVLFIKKIWIMKHIYLIIFISILALSLAINILWKFIFNFGKPVRYYPGAVIESDQPNALIVLLLDFPAFFYSLIGGQIYQEDLNRGILFRNFAHGVSWSDFDFPSIVGILMGFSLLLVLSISTTKSSLPKILSIIFVFFSLISVIIYTRGFDPTSNDSQITPRYMFPLFLLLIALALLIKTANYSLLGPVQSLVITSFLTIGGSLAWLVTISRFSIGPNAAFTNFWKSPEWWALSTTFSRLEFFALATLITFFWYLSTIYAWGRMKESNEPTFIKTLKE